MGFRVLGPLEVVAGNEPVRPGPPKQRALLRRRFVLVVPAHPGLRMRIILVAAFRHEIEVVVCRIQQIDSALAVRRS